VTRRPARPHQAKRRSAQVEQSAGDDREDHDRLSSRGSSPPLRPGQSPPRVVANESDPEGPFIAIDMPERFVLEVPAHDGGWIDHGLCERQAFKRESDGTTVCLGHGSPLILRCIRQRGDLIDVADHDGTVRTLRLVPFPSERYKQS